MELTELRGIGPKTEKLFRKLGITKAEELLTYFPYAYLHYPHPQPIAMLTEGEPQAVMGMLEGEASAVNVHGLRMTVSCVRDISGRLRLQWFHAPFLRNKLHAGTVLVFFGRMRSFRGQKSMSQPKIFTPEEYWEKEDTLEPVYGLTRGLSNAAVRQAVCRALESCPPPSDFVPEHIRTRRQLMDMPSAVRSMHFPSAMGSVEPARQRLAYNELFLFSLALAEKKKNHEKEASDYIIPERPELKALVQQLPFTLTEGQERAVRDITADLGSGFVMNRLLQGDVGSGKTIVAFLALFQTAFCGFQAALMAPTEILAEQHYTKLRQMLETYQLPFRAVLVTGALTEKEKKAADQRIHKHETDIIIGTHALFQEKLVYDQLALVVTDEQHRFGVQQRQQLSEKGGRPHTLVMSATPIPRTLAMLLYADMKVSTIRSLPADRLPIKNAVVDEHYRRQAYKFIYDEIRKGRQAYVICPMVEPEEALSLENVTDYTVKLREIFPQEVRIGMLHGKMKPKEKDAVMEAFLRRELDLLVSTTVVEVGVDVPNATVMMVENAERFGLAQLHQLRGRVGRSEHQSYCVFVDTQRSEKSKQRLEILSSSNDGFYIAEQDLRLRGPGDIFGVQQSGALDFRMADLYKDQEILQQAAEDAGELVKEDPELRLPAHAELKKQLMRYLEKSSTL